MTQPVCLWARATVERLPPSLLHGASVSNPNAERPEASKMARPRVLDLAFAVRPSPFDLPEPLPASSC